MWKKGIRVIVSFVVVLLVWQIACTVTNANATLFPSPVKVGEEFVKLFTQGLEGSTSHVTLPGHIRISLLRFATGYVLAAVSAILLGLILGSLPKVFQFINPILQIIRPIAPVAFLPFIVFWFGIGDVPAIVIMVARSASKRMQFLLSIIRNPSPDCAPTISPETRKIQDVPSARRSAFAICVKIAGNTMPNNVFTFPTPKLLAIL